MIPYQWLHQREEANATAWEEYLENGEGQTLRRNALHEANKADRADLQRYWHEYAQLAKEPIPPVKGEGMSSQSQAPHKTDTTNNPRPPQ